MFPHPVKLGMMALEHLDLEIDLVGDVHELIRNEIDAGKSIHVIYRDKLRGLLHLGRPIGKRCRERGVEHQFRRRRMVGHVVVWIVRDDEVWLGILDQFDNLVAALRIVGIYVEIIEHATDHLNARKLPCLFRLVGPHRDQFVRRDDHMAKGSVAEVGDNNLVTALHAFCQRSRAGDFNIIRVATDGQNVHIGLSFCFGLL